MLLKYSKKYQIMIIPENIEKDEKTINVRVKDNRIELKVEQIIYCEADGDYTKIFMFKRKKPYFASGCLLKTGQLIDSAEFQRISHKHLVNLQYYVHLNTFENKRDLHLEEGIVLQVSDRKLPVLRNKLKQLGLKK